jgi:DNA-binding transcriptional regulator YiaG
MSIKIFIKTDNVKIILAKKNIDLSCFAERVGVHRSTISMWFAHQKCPSAESRRKIHEVLGKTRRWDNLFQIHMSTITSEVTDE